MTYVDNRVFINNEDVGSVDAWRYSAVELATNVPATTYAMVGSTPVVTGPSPVINAPVSVASTGKAVGGGGATLPSSLPVSRPVAPAAPGTATAPVSGTASSDAAPTEWLALGTFAMATDRDAPFDPNNSFAIQLAVSKDGLVSGSFHDPDHPDTVFPVQGRVDPDTQRVAMTVAGLDDVVFETGIYNLTQQETPLLVHDADRTMKSYLLVRLPEPEPESVPEPK